MVRAITAFTEFCYLARRSVLTEETLTQMAKALEDFHRFREIFRTTGVRDNFSLPRQHSLNHYARHIREFGAPNGLCSSITESRHIKAIKQPYRRSSRFEALAQMLLINQRLDKLAAARSDFTERGMLKGSLFVGMLAEFTARMREDRGADEDDDEPSEEPGRDAAQGDMEEGMDDNWAVVPGARVDAVVKLAQRKGQYYLVILCLTTHSST